MLLLSLAWWGRRMTLWWTFDGDWGEGRVDGSVMSAARA